jgi:hypothetical protein
MVPDDSPFVRLRAIANHPELPPAILRNTLFDSAQVETGQASESWSWDSYDENDFYTDDTYDLESDYSYLGRHYDTSINDPQDARVTEPDKPGGNPVAAELEQQFSTNVQAALAPARPSSALVTTRPHTTDGPLFVEFQRAAIIHLQSAVSLRRDLLERAIALGAQGRLTVAGRGSEPAWENHREGERVWRQLRLPMLGWEICYAIKEGELIVANSAELLRTVLDSATSQHSPERSRERSLEVSVDAADDLTVVRFDQRKSAFDDIMKTLDQDGIQGQTDSRQLAEAFFSGNIGSLLDVASDVSRVEIARRASSNGLHVELHFVLNSSE